MKKLAVFVLILICALPAFGQAGGSSLSYSGLGFSMKPLEAKKEATLGVILYTMLPPTFDFAPNVNVMVQEYAGSLADYKALSDQQIVEMGLSIVKSEIVGGAEFVMEYKGKQNDLDLHFLVRAIPSGSRYYLVTGTTLEKQWRGISKQIRDCVESFAFAK
jgi:hypothetical protein